MAPHRSSNSARRGAYEPESLHRSAARQSTAGVGRDVPSPLIAVRAPCPPTVRTHSASQSGPASRRQSSFATVTDEKAHSLQSLAAPRRSDILFGFARFSVTFGEQGRSWVRSPPTCSTRRAATYFSNVYQRQYDLAGPGRQARTAQETENRSSTGQRASGFLSH
jgi:hypothetical protein